MYPGLQPPSDYTQIPPSEYRKPSTHPLLTPGKKMVVIDGKPTPLLWADGITQIDQLDVYKATGFNTVVVRLRWLMTEDGTLASQDLEPPRAFALAAAQRGLNVIYSLPAFPVGMEDTLRIAADSDPYFMMWGGWVDGALTMLKDTPRLLGWMLPDDPRALSLTTDVGFTRWLASNYADVRVLNRQWNTFYESLEDVTLADVELLMKAWRGPGENFDALSQEELQERNLIDSMREKMQADRQRMAFPPAALALAHYKWDSYRALLTRWVRTIKKIDPQRLVLSGRLRDYAQLLSLPHDIDISIPDIQPGAAEADPVTHNPQAVDVARRGGNFAATPVLATSASFAVPREMLHQLVPAWTDAALVHGASGLVFSSWRELHTNQALHRAVAATLQRLNGPTFTELWTKQPVATAAILLTPLADGHTLQRGPVGRDGNRRGMYGFGEHLVNGEPSYLVYALRWGTSLGSVDYLAPDDFSSTAGAANVLQRYSVLLMPQALSVTHDVVQHLVRYVAGGGVVVADLGIGAAQAGGQVTALPPAIAGLFGVGPVNGINTMSSFNLQGVSPHPLLPTWSQMIGQRRSTVLTTGDSAARPAFGGPVISAGFKQGAVPIAQANQLQQPSWLTINQTGAGFAVFAPFRLWDFWRPGHFGFADFHSDLFARGAAVMQLEAPSFVPAPGPPVNDGAPLYPEIVNFPSSIALLNHSVPGAEPQAGAATVSPTSGNPVTAGAITTGSLDGTIPEGMEMNNSAIIKGLQYASVQTVGVENFLWSDAVCVFPSSDEPMRLAGGRPAPVVEADKAASQQRPVTLHAATKAQEMKVLRMLPVRAQNTGGGPLVAQVRAYNSKVVRMVAWPNALAVLPQGESFDTMLAGDGPLRVTLYDAIDVTGYRVRPGSRHRVTITSLVNSSVNSSATLPPQRNKSATQLNRYDGRVRKAVPQPTTEAAPQSAPQSTTRTVLATADSNGRLVVEARGSAIIVEIAPAA